MSSNIIKWKWSDGSINVKTLRQNEVVLVEEKNINKREEQNEKINERMLLSTMTCNPFMANNDYIKDLEMQDTFLKPQKK